MKLTRDDPFGALVNAIVNDEFVETDNAITLTNERLTWVFDNFRTLFIRPFYRALLESDEAVCNFSPTKVHKFIVLGNPSALGDRLSTSLVSNPTGDILPTQAYRINSIYHPSLRSSISCW
jgi:hypothetical protein